MFYKTISLKNMKYTLNKITTSKKKNLLNIRKYRDIIHKYTL